jgi:hypothetical protein
MTQSLLSIQGIIARYGGNKSFAALIEKEWGFDRHKDWDDPSWFELTPGQKDAAIKDNWHKLNIPAIAALTGQSLSTVGIKGRHLALGPKPYIRLTNPTV